ncbi:MAG: PDZ domain-containing protein [bacterium]|nr:PDZ domain-containing protein [bacterium]
MKSRPRISAWRAALWIAALLGALFYLPVPYYVMAPGDAVDLRDAIEVAGHPGPPHPLYLTDVLIYRASPLGLLSKFAPGYRLVPRSEFTPDGVSYERYQQIMLRSMTESQQAAAVVAERAAGYHVATPPSRVRVVAVTAKSRARDLLRPGDSVVAADGQVVDSLARLIAVVNGHAVGGPPVALRIERDGLVRGVAVPTITTTEGPRIGVLIAAEPERARLPVPVSFGGPLARISGSSGGLMMALDIYSALERRSIARVSVAGTGTLDFDGGVGPIDGAAQKVIAAKRAGAKIFLCPRENYREIAHTSGIEVIPVATFGDALNALTGGMRRKAA